MTLNDTLSTPAESTDRPSRRTDQERKALTAIINTWVGMAPIHYASAGVQVNAHFGVASVDSLTIGQVREASGTCRARSTRWPTPPPSGPDARRYIATLASTRRM